MQKFYSSFNFYLDFEKLEKTCQKKPLEKYYLSVKRVPVSKCICVSGFSEDTSKSTLEFYFDNERKSGGVNVTDVKMDHEENMCLVFFEDPKGKIMFYVHLSV